MDLECNSHRKLSFRDSKYKILSAPWWDFCSLQEHYDFPIQCAGISLLPTFRFLHTPAKILSAQSLLSHRHA